MNSRFTTIIIGAIVVLLLANSTLYVVQETERAVKLRFGSLVDDDIAPGLHVKWPIAEDVRKFDSRVLTLDAEPASFYTTEKKRLIVDSYAKWRIADVGEYYRATGGNEEVAHNRLASRVNDGLRNQFGARTLHEVVSGERDMLMQNITNDLNKTVRESLGVDVVDVRVKRIDLPDEVSEPVYRRMKAEREKEARETRSDWVDPDEAATILGIQLQKSGNHRRRVRWLAEKGFLVKYRPGKPPAYWREELEKVSAKIARGEIAYIGQK